MFNRLRFTPARLCARRARRGDLALSGVAGEAVGSFTADGADGGQVAPRQTTCKSRRWRHGDGRRHEAVTQPYRVTARHSRRGGSDGAGLAGLSASAVTERAGERVHLVSIGSGALTDNPAGVAGADGRRNPPPGKGAPGAPSRQKSRGGRDNRDRLNREAICPGVSRLCPGSFVIIERRKALRCNGCRDLSRLSRLSRSFLGGRDVFFMGKHRPM